MKTNQSEINVSHEWGALKEVILGIGEDLIEPEYNKSVTFIYDKKYLEAMKKYGGQAIKDIEPEIAKQVKQQIDGLANLLEKRGIIVHRSHRLKSEEMQYLTNIQKGAMFLYARDPILVIGHHVIETALKVPMRTKEKFAIRPILQERLKNNSAQYVSIPSVSPAFDENNIYLEGGDVLLNGNDIYVGNSGRASNGAGIAWLQNYLGSQYHVHEIKLSSDFEHLDCVMALLRPGLGIIYSKGIKSALPDSLKDWDFIEVTDEEVKRLAANAFVLDAETAILDAQHHLIAEELRKRGHTIIELPYDKVATFGGAFRCSHHPLVREI
ncbi:MAG: arginine deiminase family protein [Gammaproteobacteria bacterium]